MRALILRPEPQASAMAAGLSAAGVEPTVAPMLEIAPLPDAAAGLAARADALQGLVLTSAAAAAALAEAGAAAALAAVPVIAVGPATAAAAGRAGFATVVTADGDGERAIAAVVARFDPHGGPVVHVAGRERAVDVAGALAAAGFTAETAVVYAAEPVTALSPDLAFDLDGGRFGAVIVASARTAAAFGRCLEQASVTVPVPGAALVAISAKAAAPLRPLFDRLVLAAAPDGESLTKAVVALAAASREQSRRPGGSGMDTGAPSGRLGRIGAERS